jgi:hypothetical protein
VIVLDDDDLVDLQVVSKREYRRGYRVNGWPRRVRYRKLLRTRGGYVVCRPSPGQEKFKTRPQDVARVVGLLLLVGGPVTLWGLLALIGLIALPLR